jgi:hypothetical protein
MWVFHVVFGSSALVHVGCGMYEMMLKGISTLNPEL